VCNAQVISQPLQVCSWQALSQGVQVCAVQGSQAMQACNPHSPQPSPAPLFSVSLLLQAESTTEHIKIIAMIVIKVLNLFFIFPSSLKCAFVSENNSVRTHAHERI